MQRNGLLIGGWAVATVLALVLGLQGIRSVSNSVTDHRPAPLSPSSVRAALQRTTATTSTTAPSSSSSVGGAPPGSSVSSDVVVPHVNGDDGPTASDVPSTTIAAGDDGRTAESTPATAISNSGPGTNSTSSSSSESTAPFEDHVYDLEGGSVAVRFQGGAAHLLWARANPNYWTDQAQEDGGTVDVRFRNDEHESRLRAYWDNGPQAQIEESD